MRFLNYCNLVFALAMSLLIFSACQSSGDKAHLEQELSVPDSTSVVQSGDVRIGAMDVLEISIFGAQELNNSYQVDFEGILKMPLIGSFDARGFTAAELATNLEDRFKEKYLQDPNVTVRITETKNSLITVDGSVSKPGMYPVEGQLSLLQAVALSGGPTEGANPKRVIVFRQIDGKRNAAGFDLTQIRAGKAEDPLVYGNDIIVVDGSEARKAYGEFIRSVPLLALFLVY